MDRKTYLKVLTTTTAMPPWFPRATHQLLDKADKIKVEFETGGRVGIDIKDPNTAIVYVIQEISGTRHGAPKINIMGAQKYGKFVFCLPEMAQIIFSPGPLIFKLRKVLKNYTPDDFLLLTGDPAIIGVACSIVSDITNGKYKLLKWDKQERRYYPIVINLQEKGDIDENDNGTTGSARI